MALLAVVDFLVLPQISGTRRALDLLHTVRPGWVIVAALLEGLSLGCYSLLTRSVLLGGPPGYSWLLRTDLTDQPGGLGIIEAVLIPSLVGFETPRAVAARGLVSWRLVNFWAPIPTAGMCYLSLRTQRWWNRHRPHRPPP